VRKVKHKGKTQSKQNQQRLKTNPKPRTISLSFLGSEMARNVRSHEMPLRWGSLSRGASAWRVAPAARVVFVASAGFSGDRWRSSNGV
jgi:hypothetical protein